MVEICIHYDQDKKKVKTKGRRKENEQDCNDIDVVVGSRRQSLAIKTKANAQNLQRIGFRFQSSTQFSLSKKCLRFH